MLSPMIADCRFLDLFAGSGAIGIEALSRGASSCCFVEKERTAVACIRDNLKKTNLAEGGTVLPMDVRLALDRLSGQEETFHLIFLDPPYRLGIEREVIGKIAAGRLLAPGGLMMVEAQADTDLSFVEDMTLQIIREKYYKTNKHVFIKRQEDI